MSIFKSPAEKNTIDNIANKADAMVDSAEHSAKQALSTVDMTAHELATDGASLMELTAERARLYTNKGVQMAKHAADAVKEKTGVYADTASEKIKANPLTSVAIAAAVGAAVAAVSAYALGRKSDK
jgi:ElaB/YqjD/DUF883 family membrane-anchored ribosome-binding protein